MTEQELRNRIMGSVGDDHYLDEDEDKSLMQAATAAGMDYETASTIIDAVCRETGSAREKPLLEELKRMVMQRTQADKFLDLGEEAECLRLCDPAPGYSAGLDSQKARQALEAYCAARGIRLERLERATQPAQGGLSGLVKGGLAIALLLLVGFALVRASGTPSSDASHAPQSSASTAPIATSTTVVREPIAPENVADPNGLHKDPEARAATATSTEPPPNLISPERASILNRILDDAEGRAAQGIWTEPPDGSVLYFLNSFWTTVLPSDRAASNYASIGAKLHAVCDRGVKFYCERAISEGMTNASAGRRAEAVKRWRSRAELLAAACREPELVANCAHPGFTEGY
jgi:hypothetical protein